ncbi:MAG: Crp/Fnr family transcriptional regulator [Bacteroidales bacterium]|nr:Crp/Fnr family transcriptional regulator [Bacteroidales bacterium]
MKTIQETDNEFICDIHLPCFQLLSKEEIELVRASKTQVIFRRGDNLTKQGAFASYVLFIINGLAKQYVEDNGKKDFNLQVLKPGMFVGLSAVFSKATFSYSSSALTNCQAFLIEKEAISNVIKQNGMFSYTIFKRYSEYNSMFFDSLRSILFKQMNGRMAETILYLDGLKDIYADIFQLLTRRDIADFANVSSENAVKLLKNFERDGLIELKEKDVIVVNREGLLEVSKKG